MKEGYWVIRTYTAGSVGEKIKYFVPGTRPTGKVRRRDKDAIRKQEQNEYASQKAAARLLNENFHAGDLLMGLDYSPKGMGRVQKRARRMLGATEYSTEEEKEAAWIDAQYDAAEKELENGLRRVKRILQAQGIELKAFYITSDMDGDTGEQVRLHHHLVVNKEAKDAFLAAWEEKGMGGVSYSPLRENQQDRTEIAAYFLRQVRRRKDHKKFRATRNLVRVMPKDKIALTDAELRVPAGGKLIYRQGGYSGQAQYIRYIVPQKEPKSKPETEFRQMD